MLRQGRVMTVDGIAVHGFTAPGYLLLDNGRQAVSEHRSVDPKDLFLPL